MSQHQIEFLNAWVILILCIAAMHQIHHQQINLLLE